MSATASDKQPSCKTFKETIDFNAKPLLKDVYFAYQVKLGRNVILKLSTFGITTTN